MTESGMTVKDDRQEEISSTSTSTSTSSSVYDTSKFDHVFSGWSIWIEPGITNNNNNNNHVIATTMNELQTACGGIATGTASFVPHVTLLYNIPPLCSIQNPNKNENDNNNNNNSSNKDNNVWCFCDDAIDIDNDIDNNNYNEQREEKHQNVRMIQERLETCWNEFKKSQERQGHSDNNNNNNNNNDLYDYKLLPMDWYYFHYPKSADDGKGFGCSIALLLIQSSSWLVSLQHTCRTIFGMDERGSRFIPHLSLVYAPEDYSAYLQSYVETKKQQEQRQRQQSTTNATTDTTIPAATATAAAAEKDVVKTTNVTPPPTSTTTTPQTETTNDQGNPNEIPNQTTASSSSNSNDNNNNNSNHDDDDNNVIPSIGPLPAKYLSIWSTQGKIQDWYRIAKIPMVFSSKK